MLEWLKTRRDKPRVERYRGLVLESSAVCNLRCPLCVLRTYETQVGRGHMSADTIRAVLPYLDGLSDIDLTGWGEPLLNPGFFENIYLLRPKFPGRITMTTNGTLLSEEAIKRLIDAELDTICFSIDAAYAKSYAEVRPGGDFDKLVSMLIKFVSLKQQAGASRPYLFATYLIRRDLADEIPAFAKLIKELGLNGVVLQHLTGVFNHQTLQRIGYSGYYNDSGTFDSAPLLSRLSEARAVADKNFLVLMPELIYPERVGNCGGFNMDKPFISASGEVTICCSMAYPTETMGRDYAVRRRKVIGFGNVNQEPLPDIWARPDFLRLRAAIRSGKSPAACADCIGLYLIRPESEP